MATATSASRIDSPSLKAATSARPSVCVSGSTFGFPVTARSASVHTGPTGQSNGGGGHRRPEREAAVLRRKGKGGGGAGGVLRARGKLESRSSSSGTPQFRSSSCFDWRSRCSLLWPNAVSSGSWASLIPNCSFRLGLAPIQGSCADLVWMHLPCQ